MARRRWIVVAMWLFLMLVAVVLRVPRAATVVKGGGGLEVPGSASTRVATLLKSQFGASPRALLVVYHSRNLKIDSPKFRQIVEKSAVQLRKLPRIRSVTTYF